MSRNSFNLRRRLLPRNGLLRSIIEALILVIMVYTPINLLTTRAYIEGPSMQPNLYEDQRLIINRATYYFSAPVRGDIVVLHSPTDANGDDLIKRVIGLPNESVEIRQGQVFIDGAPLTEPYVKFHCEHTCDGKWTLSKDEYFVLGDNRPHSYDSHNFGPIHRSLIVGQAWIRYFPFSDFTVFSHPDYGPLATPTIALP